MKNEPRTNPRPFNVLLRAMNRVLRTRYTAHIHVDPGSTLTGGGQKLEPIADILARSGRAPRAPD